MPMHSLQPRLLPFFPQMPPMMLLQPQMMQFSVMTRKLAVKKLAKRRVKKYKLKTKKALQKRVRVVGSFREKAFKYFAVGHRHLMRNKSKRRRSYHRTHRHLLTCPGDQRRAKRLLPYFKKSKFLKC